MANLRNAIILRDNKTCQFCNQPNNKFDVHHLNHYNSTIEEIITLCKKCHKRIHYIEKTIINGEISFLSCKKCYDNNKTNYSFLLFRLKGSKRDIFVCQSCGRGVIYDKDGNEVDSWEEQPFHEYMMKIYFPLNKSLEAIKCLKN